MSSKDASHAIEPLSWLDDRARKRIFCQEERRVKPYDPWNLSITSKCKSRVPFYQAKNMSVTVRECENGRLLVHLRNSNTIGTKFENAT